MIATSHSLSTGRKATATQGWTLASANWLAAVAASVLAPVLPKITQHFQGTPHVDVLISLVATLPALFVAVGAWPAGLLADRFGTRRVLLFGVGTYGFVGCAPIVIDSLPDIVITRAGVGIAEAIIMVCTTALVADYFYGNERERWLAVQTGGGGAVSVLMIAIGGLLGHGSWRIPFIMYGLGFIFFLLCLFKTWEPSRDEKIAAEQAGNEAEHPSPTQSATEKYNWGPLAWISVITLFSCTSYFVMMIQLSFILTERGVTDSGTIGLGCASAVLFLPLGSVVFKLMRLSVAGKLTVSFTLSAVGFFTLALAHSFLFTEIGAAINGLGSGIVLPTLITWALTKMTPEVRARGTGIWQTSVFLGMFLSPLSVLFLKNTLGSLSKAILAFAVALSFAAIAAVLSCIRTGLQIKSRRVEAG